MTKRSRAGRGPALLWCALVLALLASGAEADEPSASVRVITSDADGVVLEVTTGELGLVPAEAPAVGYDRATLFGAGFHRRVGAPRVPVVGTLVALPPGAADAVVEILETDSGTLYRNVSLEPVPLPVVEEGPATTRPGLRLRIDESTYARDADYPSALAELGERAMLRDQAVVALRVHPVRFNPVQGTLRHYGRVRVRVRFLFPPVGIAATSPPPRASSPEFERILERLVVNYARPEVGTVGASATGAQQISPAAAALASSGARIKLGVETDGFYRVTALELQTAGFDIASVDPQMLRVRNLGQEIAVRVLGEGDGIFDPNDSVEFYGEAMTGEFTRRNIYWLEVGGSPGARMLEPSVAPSGSAPIQTTHATTVHAEDGNGQYWQAMPFGNGRDHYFWQRLFAPSSNPFAVTLPNLSSPAPSASIRVALHGRTNVVQNPDHHTRVHVNGNTVDDQFWEGQIPFEHSASFAHSILLDGANTVAIELVNDTGAIVDSIYINFIEIDYTADLTVIGDELRFSGSAGGPLEYRVDGFSEAAIELYDVTDPLAVEHLVGGQVTGPPGDSTLAFEDDPAQPRRYLAVADSATRTPVSIELDTPSDLANAANAANGADHLVISHADFLSSMTPLADLRAAQGLRTFVVDIEDIYDEFSFGVFDPIALRDFIQFAYNNWQAPAPTFVVLVGDANQDYLDYLGSGAPNFVPTHLFETVFFGQAPEDNFFAAVSGGDILPDVLLGRISVRTAAEADAVVAKIVAYEAAATSQPWNQDALFVADDGGEGFGAILDGVAATFLPASNVASKVYLDDFPDVAAARTALTAEIDAGTVVATYLGHGAISVWASEAMLSSSDIASWSNGSRNPFIATLNCINGYYPHWSVGTSMAEALLNEPSGGAAAVWSPTGLGFLSDYASIADELYENIFSDGVTVLGEATVDAVTTAFIEFTASGDHVHELVLFGDPALRLAINRDTDDVLDRVDNCPELSNPAQENFDGDAEGDVCDADDDDDGLLDIHETGTGIYVSPTDTGSDPLDSDTDGDGIADGDEVAAGTDPNDPASPGAPAVPSLGPVGCGLLLLVILATARRARPFSSRRLRMEPRSRAE